MRPPHRVVGRVEARQLRREVDAGQVAAAPQRLSFLRVGVLVRQLSANVLPDVLRVAEQHRRRQQEQLDRPGRAPHGRSGGHGDGAGAGDTCRR
eukprot:4819587-Prymnesium_polylepis.1